MLLLCGPEQAWRFDFRKPHGFDFDQPVDKKRDGGFFTVIDRPVFVEEVGEESGTERCDGETHHTVLTALTVWDCSIVLAKFLEAGLGGNGGFDVRGRRVVELGSGRGIVGIAASILGARVTLTDVHTIIPDLKEIVALNQVKSVDQVVPLDWTNK
ncbi:hypothetical protein HDU67_010336 [Dinochytrium kinnereticum]|nr:hypothetical protein HDU67_010336 [Dinochytrium kinnereticum]